MRENFKNRSHFRNLLNIADGIQKLVGKNCEVAIHDLSTPESSLAYVSGNVTNRTTGAPITNIVLKNIRLYGNNSSDLIGYKTITNDGKVLKSSTIYVRDDEGNIIGCFCINLDITESINYKYYLEQITAFGTESEPEGDNNEFFASDVTEILETLIEQVINSIETPMSSLQKDHKMRIVGELDQRGVFLIKGAIDKVASVLGVSRYTIYNYLEQERSNR